MSIRPAIGCSRPIRYRSRVLLPLPDPPRIAIVVPRSTLKLTCSMSTREPQPMRRSSTMMWARDWVMSDTKQREDEGKQGVGHNHAEDRQYHGACRPGAHRGGAALRRQPLSACDEAYRQREEWRLDQTFHEVTKRDGLSG